MAAVDALNAIAVHKHEKSLVGRTITKAVWDWGEVWLAMDDGSAVHLIADLRSSDEADVVFDSFISADEAAKVGLLTKDQLDAIESEEQAESEKEKQDRERQQYEKLKAKFG